MRYALLLRAALLLVPVTVGAQPASAQLPAAFPRHMRTELSDPTLTSTFRIPTSEVILSGSTESSVAKAEVGVQGIAWGLRLTAQSPLEKGEDEAALLGLDGLRNSSTVGLGVNWLRWRPGFRDMAAAQAICDSERVKVCDKSELPKSRHAEFDATVNYGTRISFAAEVEVGRETFEFSDPVTLEQGEEERTPLGVSVAAGAYIFKAPRLLRGLWTVSLEGQRSFKSGSEMELCAPFGSTGATRCRTTRVGGPAEQERLILTGSHRARVGALAFDPRVHYDFEGSELGVEIPVYFLRGTGTSLTGGLSVGWSSGSDRLSIQVFTGPVFSIFGAD